MRRFADNRKQRGAVAIEFALIFPLFLIVLYGIISYSIYFVALNDLNRLSGEAARSAIALERQDSGLPEGAAIGNLVEDLVSERAVFKGLIARCDEGEFFPDKERELVVCLRMNQEAFPLPVIEDFFGVTIPDLSSSIIRSRVSL